MKVRGEREDGRKEEKESVLEYLAVGGNLMETMTDQVLCSVGKLHGS